MDANNRRIGAGSRLSQFFLQSQFIAMRPFMQLLLREKVMLHRFLQPAYSHSSRKVIQSIQAADEIRVFHFLESLGIELQSSTAAAFDLALFYKVCRYQANIIRFNSLRLEMDDVIEGLHLSLKKRILEGKLYPREVEALVRWSAKKQVNFIEPTRCLASAKEAA